MTQPDDNPMNETGAHPTIDCRTHMTPVMTELRKTVAEAAARVAPIASEVRRRQEADLCLATRSAYFDFYTWLVIHGTIEDDITTELDQLFRSALAWMEPGEFRESVEE